MDLQELQSRVSARVREIPLLVGLPVFDEDRGNVVENVRQEIAKSSFCVVVGALSFTDEAPDASRCYGTARVAISVFEDPMLNRAGAGRPTFLAAAQEIARALKLFDTGDGVLTSPAISAAENVGGGVVALTVTLSLKTTL
ncbi:MAG: hypothetical protein ACI4RA_05530 [Kiritimatiellia bacterium]